MYTISSELPFSYDSDRPTLSKDAMADYGFVRLMAVIQPETLLFFSCGPPIDALPLVVPLFWTPTMYFCQLIQTTAPTWNWVGCGSWVRVRKQQHTAHSIRRCGGTDMMLASHSQFSSLLVLLRASCLASRSGWARSIRPAGASRHASRRRCMLAGLMTAERGAHTAQRLAGPHIAHAASHRHLIVIVASWCRQTTGLPVDEKNRL